MPCLLSTSSFPFGRAPHLSWALGTEGPGGFWGPPPLRGRDGSRGAGALTPEQPRLRGGPRNPALPVSALLSLLPSPKTGTPTHPGASRLVLPAPLSPARPRALGDRGFNGRKRHSHFARLGPLTPRGLHPVQTLREPPSPSPGCRRRDSPCRASPSDFSPASLRAFFWLVSLLLASVVWFILVHVTDQSDARLQYGLLIFGAAVSVLLQEVFRFAYYKLLKKADEGLASLSEDGRSPISIRQMAYVSGLSFGIISGVFSVINILADALGPGVVGIHGDSPFYFLTSAFLTAALILLHTFWGIVFFDACERRRYWALGLVVGSHLLTSGLTFLNPWYEASLLPIYAVTLSMGIWAFITAGGSLRSIQRSLSCKD
uniref:Gamma-secretase subunit APH-1 n=1 Tax=Sarcophilus harrisii TaxID=9305 RepID=A0A7N4P9F1_SARHA